MEITEEHLQRTFDELEEYANKNSRNGEEYGAIVFAAWSMRTKLLSILRSASEKDLELTKMISKDFVKMLVGKGENASSLVYKCGHSVRPVIMNTVSGSLETYLEWKNDPEGICIECWMMEKKKKDIMEN